MAFDNLPQWVKDEQAAATSATSTDPLTRTTSGDSGTGAGAGATGDTQTYGGADAYGPNMQPDGTYRAQTAAQAIAMIQAGVPQSSIVIPDGSGGYRPPTGHELTQAQISSTGDVHGVDTTGNTYGTAASAVSGELGLPDLTKALGSLGIGGSNNSSGIVDAVNKVAAEAQGLAPGVRDFQLAGLDKSDAAFDPATQQYNSMYGPGGSQTTPGAGEQAFSQQGGNLLNPTAQGQVLSQTQGYLGGQSPGMSALGQVAGQLGGPTLSGQTYGQYASQLGAPSAGEQRYDATSGQYDTNALQQQAGGLNAQYAAPTNLESSLGTIAGKYSQPTASGTTFNSQQGQLSGPGALEQFAASDLNGTNPYYAQLQQQQDAALNAQFNARGGYNSGAALNALALNNASLAAQQYQQEGQLQGSAQTAQGARLAQNQSAAGAADTSNYQGLSGLTGALGTADAQRLAATNGQVGLAGAQSGMDLSYLQGGQSAANQAGSADLARTQAGIGLTSGTDATNLAQNLGYVGAADAAGAGQTSQYSALGSMAQGADAATQAQYMNYLNQAQNSQAAGLQRGQTGVADATAIGNAQAGNTISAYNNAGTQYTNMIDTSMGAQLNAAQLQAQQNQQNQANTLGYAGLLTKAFTS